ncbi:hypothetical protein SPPR111872_02395 [Sphingobacterium prati]
MDRLITFTCQRFRQSASHKHQTARQGDLTSSLVLYENDGMKSYFNKS